MTPTDMTLKSELHDLCDVWCCVANALSTYVQDHSVPSPVLYFAFSGVPGQRRPFRAFVPSDKLEDAGQQFISTLQLAVLDPDLEGKDSIVDAMGAIFLASNPEGDTCLGGFVVNKYTPEAIVGFSLALGEGPSVMSLDQMQLTMVTVDQVPQFGTFLQKWQQIVGGDS